MNWFFRYCIVVLGLSFSSTCIGQSFDVFQVVKKKISSLTERDNRTPLQIALGDSLEIAKQNYIRLIHTTHQDSIGLVENEYAKYIYLTKYNINEAKYLYYRGLKHHIRGEIDSSLFYYEKSLYLIPESYPGTHVHKYRIMALCRMASIYHHQLYNPTQAMEFLEDALDRCDEHFYPGYRLHVKSLIASIYSYGDDFREAIKVCEDALNFNVYNKAWDLGGKDYLSYILIEELARLYRLCDDCNDQKRSFEKLNSVLSFYQKDGDVIGEMKVLSDLAAFHFEYLTKKNAEEYMQSALSLPTEYRHTPVVDYIQFNHGRYLSNIGKYNESISLLENMRQLEDTTNLLFHKSVNEILYQNFLKINNEEEAESALSRVNEYKVQLQEKYSSNKISKLKETHDLDEDEHLVTLLQRRTEVIYSLGILSFVLLAVSLFLLGLTFYSRRKIRKQNKELKEANKAKNELFLILSHDLKGPISSFDNLGKRVSYLLNKKDYAGLEKFTNYFTTAGESLKHTVTNLLEWSLSQKDNFILEPEHIDVYEIMNTIVEDVQYLSTDKGIEISVEIDKENSIYCDKNAFLIIYRNLLSNAIINGDRDSQIQILSKEDAMINIDIINVTSSISEDRIKKLRAAIEKTKSGISLEMRTSGIGLHTVSNLIRHNQGKISLKILNDSVTVKTWLPKRSITV